MSARLHPRPLCALLLLSACAGGEVSGVPGDAGWGARTDAGADAQAPAPEGPHPWLQDGGTLALSDAAVEDQAGDAAVTPPPTASPLEAPPPYAAGVVEFSPGPFAGFGQDALPDVVLGPPGGEGSGGGSLDVLSLGVGGEIVLHFGDFDILDGEGPDLIVFENPFWPGGDPAAVFAELAEVAVSEDGIEWLTFPCSVEAEGAGRYPGCAGWTPTEAYDGEAAVRLDPAVTGGDAFDLATLGLSRARYLRVRDLSDSGAGNSAGFDLDAVGLVHFAPRP